jgi:chromatin remodeling complex protein RSC6
VVAPVVESHQSSEELLASVHEQLKTLNAEVSSRVRTLLRDALQVTKTLKREARDGKKRKQKNPADMSEEELAAYNKRRVNNAFLKPRRITDELAVFMGVPVGSQKSQTEVTKFVASYVKQHNCFDPTFKRRILPDQKLSALLRPVDGKEITYLNLQSYLKVHFIKTA